MIRREQRAEGRSVPAGRDDSDLKKGAAMCKRNHLCGVRSVLAIILLGIGGCASDTPKPVSTVTPEQVRGHADKAFEKLKQEEQGRSTAPAVPAY